MGIRHECLLMAAPVNTAAADNPAVDTAAVDTPAVNTPDVNTVDTAVGPPAPEQLGSEFPLGAEFPPAVRRRLRRIAGQVLGIGRMLDADRDCRDVLVQLAAAQGGLRAVSRQVFAKHLDGVATAIAAGTIPPDGAAGDLARLVALLTGGPVAAGDIHDDHSAGLFGPRSRRPQGWAAADVAPDRMGGGCGAT